MVNIKLHPSIGSVNIPSNSSQVGYLINFSFTGFNPSSSHPEYDIINAPENNGVMPNWYTGPLTYGKTQDEDVFRSDTRYYTTEKLTGLVEGLTGTSHEDIVDILNNMGYSDVELISDEPAPDKFEYKSPSTEVIDPPQWRFRDWPCLFVRCNA